MFTGLIQAVGRIEGIDGARLTVAIPSGRLGEIALGDSISVSGVCLTVIAHAAQSLAFEVSSETWNCTHLGTLGAGDAVNLEASLTPTSKIGGHFVTGHVDAVARVAAIDADDGMQRWRFSLPASIAQLVASKGSIAVDGVSLTVNAASDDWFEVMLIPHTLAHTRFEHLGVGALVNLEADLMARYAERVLLFKERSQ